MSINSFTPFEGKKERPQPSPRKVNKKQRDIHQRMEQHLFEEEMARIDDELEFNF